MYIYIYTYMYTYTSNAPSFLECGSELDTYFFGSSARQHLQATPPREGWRILAAFEVTASEATDGIRDGIRKDLCIFLYSLAIIM